MNDILHLREMAKNHANNGSWRLLRGRDFNKEDREAVINRLQTEAKELYELIQTIPFHKNMPDTPPANIVRAIEALLKVYNERAKFPDGVTIEMKVTPIKKSIRKRVTSGT